MFGSGKCCKTDCGCQKFWQKPDSSDPDMCGCEHHEAFHEQRPLGGSSNSLFSPSATSSMENNNLFDTNSRYTSSADNLFLATSRIPQEMETIRSNNVRAFLRSEEVRGRLSAVATTSASTIPASRSGVNKLNFDLHKEHSKYKINIKSKTKKNKTKAVSFEFTLIPKRSISIIPKRGNSLWDQLNSQGLLLQKISFYQNDEEYVNNQVISVFPCLSQTGWVCYKTRTTSELEETPYEPDAIKDLDYIRRASTTRSKIYIKPATGDLCESSDDDSIEGDLEIAESPDGSFQDLMKDFRHDLQTSYINGDNTRSRILINENDVIRSLFDWAKHATDNDLLRRPSIELVLEDVTDTGGAFRQITSIFWNEIRDCEIYFTDGIIDISSESRTLGKILFWTILHCGLWPQWFHKLHIKYILNEKIDVVNVLKERNPTIYRQLCDSNKSLLRDWVKDREIDVDINTLSKKEAAEYIAKFEIITIRKEALDELKAGFNRFNIIDELKDFGFHNLVRELYYKFTYDLVIDQFDSEYVDHQARSFNKPQYQLLYEKLKEMLKDMNENMLKKVIKFITGAEIIPVSPKIKISWVRLTPDDASSWINRLPRASTCGNLLTLCENYEMSHEGFSIFKQDLEIGFKNYEGFSESAYSRSYDVNFTLQDEINNSSSLETPARLFTPSVNSASTIRSSPGNTIDNAIYVNNEELDANLRQSSRPDESSQMYRWINITNPLERRTRRRSNTDSEANSHIENA